MSRSLYGGRYRTGNSIASGGMAEVFVAQDELLGRKVALKVLERNLALDAGFRERFRREAQAAASLNDPRIVSVYDWGVDEGDYYLVMEYVEGETLKDLIKEEGPLHIRRSVEIAADICEGLRAAHEKGVVHRDIKPANIAITPGGQTKVMDFGISRTESDDGQTMTKSGMVMGTARYFSPEQARGEHVDSRADIYSAGAVLFEMLTKRTPFEGDTPAAIAYKHVSEPPPRPSDFNPAVSTELDAVVLKALSKNPGNRYPDAGAMRSDLQRVLRGEPVEATPILSADETLAFEAADATMVAEEAVIANAPKSKRALVYTLTVVAFVSAIVLVAALLFSLLLPGGTKVIVPDVKSRPLEEAQRILKAAGLESVVDEQRFDENVVEGSVISQDPSEDRRVPSDTEVKLVVSKGPARVVVPDVIGKSEEEARKLIEEAGLTVGAVNTRFDKSKTSGTVLEQNPAGRAKHDRGASVTLVISAGKELVRVPSLTGRDVDEAIEKLVDARLRATIVDVCNTSQTNDEVLKQNPDPGDEVPENSSVTIEVNRSPRVPNVIGDTEINARKKLEDLGFQVEVLRVIQPGKSKRVIDQDPSAGERGCKGDKVTITVAD